MEPPTEDGETAIFKRFLSSIFHPREDLPETTFAPEATPIGLPKYSESKVFSVDKDDDVDEMHYELEQDWFLAVINGEVGACRRLLASGWNPEGQDANGLSSIDIAAQRGNVAVVRLLLEHLAPAVREKQLQREYFACRSCGLLRAQYTRFARVICPQSKMHGFRKPGKEAELTPTPPYIEILHAKDFATATKMLGKPPFLKGWWNHVTSS